MRSSTLEAISVEVIGELEVLHGASSAPRATSGSSGCSLSTATGRQGEALAA